MTNKKLYSFAEVTLIKWNTRLNELKILRKRLESRIKDMEYTCQRWQKEVNEEQKNET